MPISVFCTYSDEYGFRDWIGDESVPKLMEFLLRADRLVGFNHIRFDFGLIDGGLLREFSRDDTSNAKVRIALEEHYDLGQRDPEPGMTEKILRGKSIDVFLDIGDFLDRGRHPRKGRKCSLDPVALGMVGEGKVSERFDGGKGAPRAWRQKLALEVIAYCRIDVLRTAQVYSKLLDGDPLCIYGWPKKDEVNEFEGKVILRTR